MYYVIKLEIGTTKRIDSQHKRYVSFPINTATTTKILHNKCIKNHKIQQQQIFTPHSNYLRMS